MPENDAGGALASYSRMLAGRRRENHADRGFAAIAGTEAVHREAGRVARVDLTEGLVVVEKLLTPQQSRRYELSMVTVSRRRPWAMRGSDAFEPGVRARSAP